MDKILNKAIKKAGNQKRLALSLGVSRQFIHQLVHGVRPIPDTFVIKLNDLIAGLKE